MTNGDYVLGTRDDESARLGLQHQVWRDRVIDAFGRAGVRQGSRVLDVGAGPGYVTAELADMVGADGQVVALARAPNFAKALNERALPNVTVHEHDVTQPFPEEQFDV